MIGRIVNFLVKELQFALILVDTCLMLLVKSLDDEIVMILEFLILMVFIINNFLELFEFLLVGYDLILYKKGFLLELPVNKIDMILMFLLN